MKLFFLTPFINEFLLYLGGVGTLIKQVVSEVRLKPIEWKIVVEQVYQIGQRSIPLIAVTALSTGMVMTLQFGIGLTKFGGQPYIPKLVALSILREMGPVFTSLMVAARVGAGIASELGSMVVTQQIDAIRALGTSPIRKIVFPRVLATMIALPTLALLANFIGIFGSMVVAVTELNMDMQFFILKVQTGISINDFFAGFLKTFFFALFISLSACYFGLNVKEGTKEVGIATTRAVVVSSILVLVGDFFLTKLFWIFSL